MPLNLIRTADEWGDLNRALGGYRKLMDGLRENSTKEVDRVLDDIETRVDSGEDFESLLREYASGNSMFSAWLKKNAPEELTDEGGNGFTKGQELSGVDSAGNSVSGPYIRSVFGRPQIDTPSGPVVLSEVG